MTENDAPAPRRKDAGRYVQLTDAGLGRLQAARRRYKTPLDSVGSVSVNTLKRALRREPVFLSTLERIWEHFQGRARGNGEPFPDPIEGRDYIVPGADAPTLSPPTASASADGWISRRVPRPNRLFTGRRDVLERLHVGLRAGPAALVADPQALTGLGGIGKTQTALAYVYAYRRDYRRVFWVTAATVDSLQEGLSELAEEMKLLGDASPTKSRALAAMHDWLRNQSGWLLVLDNADDLETLVPHLPHHHAGHLLLTTRVGNTVRWAAPVALAQFGQEEGAQFLLRRAGLLGVGQTLSGLPEDTARSAMAVCENLGGLPLALDQAGAYLAQTSLTPGEYLSLYRARGLRLLDSVTGDEHASVTVTFTLALERLKRCGPDGEAAADMVRLCAFLAPDAIPELIFATGQSNRHDEICALVCGHSLAARDRQNGTLTVHRLVQTVTRDAMGAEERRVWAARAVEAVAAATPDFEFEDWPLCDLLLPQWRLCAEHIADGGIATAQAVYLLYQAGRYHRARALYAGAEAYTRRAVAMAEAVHGGDHPITADYIDEMACLSRVLDRRADAEALHARAVAILERQSPAGHALGAKLHNMALLYVHYDEYARAEAPLLRALAIYEAAPEPDRRLIATALTQLAGVYRSAGRFDRAESCCLRALELYEAELGPDHLDLATARNNLALLYLAMLRLDDAEALFGQALALNERIRGPHHPETGSVLWGLARVCWQQQRMAEADGRFRRAVAIYTRHFGPDHSRTARITGNYQDFLAETGRTDRPVTS